MAHDSPNPEGTQSDRQAWILFWLLALAKAAEQAETVYVVEYQLVSVPPLSVSPEGRFHSSEFAFG